MLLRQIQYFMAVAESHHFTKAAKQLFVSQSALSQQINKLEEDLGVKLLDRISHPITLTPAGEEFYRCAQKIISDINHLELQMQHYARDNQGTLHVGVITGLGKLPLTDIFSKFNTEISPQMQFSLTNCLSKKLCHMLPLWLSPTNCPQRTLNCSPCSMNRLWLFFHQPIRWRIKHK